MTIVNEDRLLRVLLDANLFISSFLTVNRTDSPPARIVDWAMQGNCHLVFPMRLKEGLTIAIRKPKLQNRITAEQLDRLFTAVQLCNPDVRPIQEETPIQIRDAKDRYLLEVAIANDVDVLVSGDNDVLVARERIVRPEIMTPADFKRKYLV